MYQENLLASMKEAGLEPSIVLSLRPVRLFPRAKKLWFRPESAELEGGVKAELVWFLNLPLLRIVTAGTWIFAKLLLWGWRERKHTTWVCTFNLMEPPGVFTYIAARIIRAGALGMIMDVNVPGAIVSGGVFHRLNYRLEKLLIPRFDALITSTNEISSTFAPSTPFIRIEGGIRQKQLAPPRSGRTGSSSSFTIVAVGRLDRTNGFPEILEAFSLLPGDSFALHIAGSGPLERMVSDSASRDPRIRFHGFLRHEQVLDLYKNADVQINMRITESEGTRYVFPSKLIEYFASGVPVISTYTGHVEKEFHEFVFLLDDETGPGLARMIQHVASLDPDVAQEKARLAQDYVRARMTWDIQGARFANFLREMTARRNSRKLESSASR